MEVQVINNNQQDQNNLDPELNQQLEEQAVEITKNIVDSVKLTEDEYKKLHKKFKEDEGLQMEFDQFLNDKVEVDNSDGGDMDRITTGIDLVDRLSGGGFRIGGLTQIVGQPGSFKSTLVAQIIANCQKKYDKDFLCVYYDTEAAMTTKRLSQLGVNNPPIKPYDDVTIEKLFKTIEAMSAYKMAKKIETPSLIIWDSIANTSTESERGLDNINSTMGLKQKLLSQLLPRYLPKMKANGIALVAVNQLRDRLNVGMYSPAPDLLHTANFEIPGGKAVKFNSSHLLKLQNRGELRPDQYGFNGVKLELEFLKNKDFTPYIKEELIVDFKKGVSNFWTNYNMLVNQGRLKSGAWNCLLKLPDVKFRTKDAPQLYAENPKFKEIFDSDVKEVLTTVYTE